MNYGIKTIDNKHFKNMDALADSFNNVTDLQNATYLADGDIVFLNGYHFMTDGSQHYRKIETSDDGSGIPVGSLWANLIKEKNKIISLDSFGAIGDGITDDSEVLQSALNYASDYNIITGTGVYLINQELTISKPLSLEGIEIKTTPTFVQSGNTLRSIYVSSDNVNFKKCKFTNTNTGGSLNNVFIWNTKGKSLINECEFEGNPFSGSNFNGAIAFLSSGQGSNIVSNCKFNDCAGSVFTQQPYDIITSNIAESPKDVSFVINGIGAHHCTISDNIVNNSSGISSAGHIAVEQGSSEYIISGNNIFGIRNGYGIGLVSVGGDTNVSNGGVVIGNIVDGDNNTCINPSACLVAEGYYRNVLISDNVFKNIGDGNISSSIVQVRTTDSTFKNNNIINNSGLDRGLILTPAIVFGEITIEGNTIRNNNQGFCIVLSASDFSGHSIYVKNNCLYDAIEGINTVISTVVPDSMLIENNNFKNVTSEVNVSNVFGSWMTTYFNLDANNFPHYIESAGYKEFYARQIPTNGNYRLGDKIFRNAPASGSSIGWVCTTTGTAGVDAVFKELADVKA